MNPKIQKIQYKIKRITLLKLLLLPLIFTPKLLLSIKPNRQFNNIRVHNEINTRDINVWGTTQLNGDTIIRGNLEVTGTINNASNLITQGTVSTNEIARFADNTGTKIKGSQVTIDNSGDINNVNNISVNNIDLASLSKAGNTVNWPAGSGATGTFLGLVSPTQLAYLTPGAGGDVTALSNFVNDNRILTTVNTPGKTIQQSNITLDTSSDISGVNTLTANTVNANLIGSVGGQTATDVANATIAANAATASNTASTIIKRDASGYFSATGMTGAASANVLKAGDIMTGNLTMTYPSQVSFKDFVGLNSVSLGAPSTVTTPYIVNLPANQPSSPNQFLMVTNSTTPFDTSWVAGGGSPAQTKAYYVSLYGQDTNDGSFGAPFLTVKHAVGKASGVANLANPVAIFVGPGIFAESNPILITADGISIIGSSISSTIIKPSNLAANLFNYQKSNLTLQNLALEAATGSTAAAFSLASTSTGLIRVEFVSVKSFKTGFDLSRSSGISPIILLDTIQFADCGSGTGACISASDIPLIVRNGFFIGPVDRTYPPANTAIKLTGAGVNAEISDSTFTIYNNGILIDNFAFVHILGSVFQSIQNGLVCTGHSKSQIIGCNFVLNSASTINLDANAPGTSAYLEGCLFDCEDALGNQQGTCVKVTNDAEVVINNSTLDGAVIGIDCGQASDSINTQVIASGVNLRDCTTCIQKIGVSNLSTLRFTGGSFDENTMTIGAGNSTNTTVGAFDDDGALAFGNNQDATTIPVYKVSNGQPNSPTLQYYPNFYGNKGTVYLNPNSDPTLNATVAQSNDASYYVVSGDNTKQAKINLISDTSAIGTGDSVRGWEISKLGGVGSTNGNLAFTYSDNDPTLIRGTNQTMRLNGYDNCVEFPVATNAPTPTNTIAKLVWAPSTDTKTNLYRSALDTLKTDGNFVIGTGSTLTVPAGSADAPSIIFATSTNTGIYSTAPYNLSFTTTGVQRMNISPTGIVSINSLTPTAGVVHNDSSGALSSSLIINSDITASTIQNDRLATVVTSNPTGGTIAQRDINGNFSAHAITAVGGIGAGFFASGAGNGFFATSGATFVGPLTGNATSAITSTNFTGNIGASGGDVSGVQTNLTVNTVGGVLAANLAAGANLANASTDIAPYNSKIVRRDSSGNFSANTITANLFSGPLSGNATSANIAINSTYSSYANTFTTALTGDVTGGNSLNTTIVQSIGNGARTAAQIIAATDLALSATSANTASTIVRRDLTGNFITNMITLNTSAIINPNDATTKSYVDSQVNAGGLVPKTPVLVVSTISTNTFGFDYIDSVTVANGDRVLLIAQAAPSSAIYNGIWEARAGNWTRPSDFLDTSTAGRAYVLTTSGQSQAGSSWLCSTPNAIVGTDPIEFLQFSLPGTTTGANVGSGAGQIFRDKTGITLNFKTLAALTYMQINNQANTVEIGTNATPNNATGTIVARDASGYFSATGMTGAASLNVLKSGDTMTGNLSMAPNAGTRKGTQYQDNSTGKYVGIQGPVNIPGASYTIDLPDAAPVANQFLIATSPTITSWTTIDAPPSANETYYVTKAGSDTTGNGSLSFPYATIKKAISEANTIASLTNPVVINVGPGIFVEDNSAGAIAINADGISIVGSSVSGTIIRPQSLVDNLITTTKSNLGFENFTLDGNGSSANAFTMLTSGSGSTIFNSITAKSFATGFSLNITTPTATPPSVTFRFTQFIGNTISIDCDGVVLFVKNNIFKGPLSGPTPANTGIRLTGATTTDTQITNNTFLRFNKAIETSNYAKAHILSSFIQETLNGILCTGGSQGFITGCNFIINLPASINVSASGIDSEVYIESSLLDGDDALNFPQGTGVKVFDGATIKINNSTIADTLVGIECGRTIDINQAIIQASSTNLLYTTTCLLQYGNGKLSFVGGTISNPVIQFETPANVTMAEFDTNGETLLSFGNGTDNNQKIYQVNTGQPSLPYLQYNKNFYGAKGTSYHNENAYPSPTINSTIGQTDNASYYVITGDSTKTAKIKLISDPLPGTGNSMRGWEITKLGNTGADLAFTYTNNDGAAYGPNTIMKLDGVNNQIILPTTTNTPIGTPKLVWGTGGANTNIYMSAADTLKTDGNFIIGGVVVGSTLTIPTGSAASPSLSFVGDLNTGLYSSASDNLSFSTAGTPRMNISDAGIVSIGSLSPTGVVHNDNLGSLSSSLIVDGDITVGTITNNKLATQVTSSNIPSTIVLRNGSGNFDAGTIYANLIGTVTGNLYGTATSATNATTAINFSGTLGGDVSGFMSTTTVVKVGGVQAATIASVVATVQAATDSPATPFTLVQRDASGGFTAGTIIATLSGHATQNLLKAGDSMLGTFTAIAGTTAAPSIQFTGSTNTGFSAPTPNALAFSTLGAPRMSISSGGVIAINNLSAIGVVHNNASGILTTTLISNIDIDPAAGIVDTKLATIATTGKVANSATTATSSSVQNTIVLRDNSGNFTSNIITATGGFSGTASGNLPITGGTLSGTLTLPANTAPTTSLNFTGYPTTGISATGNALSLMANNIQGINISSTGAITLSSLATTTGIVHNTSGVLSSSLIVNSDITPLTITNASIANNTITNTQIASNTITNDRLLTQTSANTPSYIVARDSSGNFAAGTITANLIGAVTGNITGAASLNLLKAGDSMLGTFTAIAGTSLSPSIQFAGSTNTGLSSPTGNYISFDTNGAEKMSISPTGTITVNTGPITLPASAALTNMLNFTGNLTTGISATGGVLSLTAGNDNVINLSSTGATITTGNNLTLPATTAPTPSLNFTGNLTTGISATGGTLSLIASNTQTMDLSSTLITQYLPLCIGGAGTPEAMQLVTTAGAVTVKPTTSLLILRVAGTVTHNITMPTPAINGQILTIMLSYDADVSTKTVNDIAAVVAPNNWITNLDLNAFSGTAGGASVSYIFLSSYGNTLDRWYRFRRG